LRISLPPQRFLIHSTSPQLSAGRTAPPSTTTARTCRHALGMADDVAEAAALGAQHAQAPARLGGQVDEVGERGLGRRGQAVLDVLVALAQDLQVQRQHQRRAVGGLGAVDQALDEVAVAHHVQLEPERVAARVLGHVLDRADAHGGQRERHAKRSPRARPGSRHRRAACRSGPWAQSPPAWPRPGRPWWCGCCGLPCSPPRAGAA
jgi:hypothetical protein